MKDLGIENKRLYLDLVDGQICIDSNKRQIYLVTHCHIEKGDVL